MRRIGRVKITQHLAKYNNVCYISIKHFMRLKLQVCLIPIKRLPSSHFEPAVSLCISQYLHSLTNLRHCSSFLSSVIAGFSLDNH